MYLLALQSICEMSSLELVWDLVGWIINALWFGIPIILIILGIIDLGKAVIASKEDEVKKATKTFGRRFMYAVAVFLVVWAVTLVFDWISGIGLNDPNGQAVNVTGWKSCWSKIRN